MAFCRSVTAANFLFVVVLTLGPHACRTGTKPSNSPPSAPPATNLVADFFSHADRQYEIAGQQAEIIRALRDMLTKSAQELRAQRYANYQGDKDTWSLTDLIKSYFVPSQPVTDWTEDRFYRDVSKPEAQDAIRKQLIGIQKETPAH